MKRNIKLFLIEWLIAIIIVIAGLTISKTFICGMICGVIYYFIIFLVEENLKEREEK